MARRKRNVRRSQPRRRQRMPRGYRVQPMAARKKKYRAKYGLQGASNSGPIVNLADSIINPFEHSSCVPDGALGTGCFTIKQTGTLTSGTTGTTYSVFSGLDPNAFVAADTAGTTATIATFTNWTNASNVAAVNALYGKCRIVSCGIKVVYTGNTINDQGILVVGQLSNDIPLSQLAGYGLTSLTSVSQYYKTYPLRSGAYVTWRPNEMDDIANFFFISSTAVVAGAAVPAPWLYISAFGVATAAASTVQYEIVCNYEGQITSQTFIAGGISGSKSVTPPVAGWYEKALSIAQLVDPIMPYVSSAYEQIMNADQSRLAVSNIGRSIVSGTSKMFRNMRIGGA